MSHTCLFRFGDSRLDYQVISPFPPEVVTWEGQLIVRVVSTVGEVFIFPLDRLAFYSYTQEF